MRTRQWLWLSLGALLALAFVAIPAVAGGMDHKCKYDTQACLNHMVSSMKDRGWVGLELTDEEANKPLTVTRVVPGSPAEAAGFRAGDTLVSVNGVKFADNTEGKCVTCEATKNDWTPGRKVRYVVSRSGGELTLEPTLAAIPSDVMAQWIGAHMIEHAEVEVAKK
ncbi:MAG: PDZ domain-containing protein [Acidobacteriia bacterium]|nr:PDZ domain-containing protein [Terriglobia bacterium]